MFVLRISFAIIFLCFKGYSQEPLGYEILKRENEVGIHVNNNANKFLDSLVNICAKEIQKENMTPQTILKQIGDNILKSGFNYFENNYSYGKALQARQFECDQFSITYLTIARKLNLPIYAVLLPQHMIVMWDDKVSKVYWETTINKEKTFADYEKDFSLDATAIKNGFVMQKVEFSEEPALANNYLGEYFMLKKEYSIAKNYFEKVENILPKLTSVQNNLGAIMQNSGEVENAKQIFIHCISVNPNDFAAYNNLGLYYYNQNNYDSALHYFNRSIKYNGKFGDSYNNRGLTLGRIGKFTEAITDFDRAISLNKEDSEYYMNKGVCFLYTKKYQESVSCFNKSIGLDPNNSNALVNIAIAKANLNARSEACEYLQKAIKLGNQTAKDYHVKICEK